MFCSAPLVVPSPRCWPSYTKSLQRTRRMWRLCSCPRTAPRSRLVSILTPCHGWLFHLETPGLTRSRTCLPSMVHTYISVTKLSRYHHVCSIPQFISILYFYYTSNLGTRHYYDGFTQHVMAVVIFRFFHKHNHCRYSYASCA